MRSTIRIGVWLGTSAILASVGACAASTKPGFDDPDASSSDSATLPGQDAAVFNTPDAADSAVNQSDSALPEVAIIYAHSPTALYKLDPISKAVSLISSFMGTATPVIDIALDANSNAFVTTFDGVYSLDLTSAICTLIQSGTYPNSLSFVPKGTLDPTQEALVGYLNSTYVRIDTKTGNITTVGGLTGGYVSSGDIVSVNGGGTFLTVKGNTCGDCLFQVNPKTGDLLKNFGSVNHAQVYGLAYWGAALYGFDNAGELFEIDAKGVLIKTTPVPVPAGLMWWGAGSTTSAPVADPDGGTIPIN